MTEATLAMLTLISGCATGGRFANLETELRDKASRDELSGVILIARDGVPELARAYGTGITLETCFNLASASKMFTLVAIEQLVEAGTIHLEDRVGAYVQNYPSVGDATISQLLSHTSGLSAGTSPEFFATISAKQTLDEMISALAAPLQAVPGTRKQYSNIGFLLLGRIVEVAAKQPFEDYVAARIAKPAGMDHTSPRGVACATPLTRGMGVADKSDRRAFSPPGGTPAGGWSSNASDLLRFANALRGHLLVKADPEALQLPIRDWDGHRMVGHNGGAPGINSEVWILPRDQYTVIVLSNFDPPSATQIADRAAELITGSKPPALGGKVRLIRTH